MKYKPFTHIIMKLWLILCCQMAGLSTGQITSQLYAVYGDVSFVQKSYIDFNITMPQQCYEACNFESTCFGVSIRNLVGDNLLVSSLHNTGYLENNPGAKIVWKKGKYPKY